MQWFSSFVSGVKNLLRIQRLGENVPFGSARLTINHPSFYLISLPLPRGWRLTFSSRHLLSSLRDTGAFCVKLGSFEAPKELHDNLCFVHNESWSACLNLCEVFNLWTWCAVLASATRRYVRLLSKITEALSLPVLWKLEYLGLGNTLIKHRTALAEVISVLKYNIALAQWWQQYCYSGYLIAL